LQTSAAKAALEHAGVKPEQIDTVNIGQVINSTTTDGIYMPRHVSLNCGIPIDRPALGVNRLCGSGFQSIVNGAQDILCGAAKVSLTGGVENMSMAPFVARNIRFGTTLGVSPLLEDSLWNSLTDSYCNLPMALTAEKLGEQFKITRQLTDEFSLGSQHKWGKANEAGVFKNEITPFKIKVKGKEVNFEVDEHPRPQTNIEGLTKLKSLFKKDGKYYL
jgi:acetyl-CoA acyltransferase 2